MSANPLPAVPSTSQASATRSTAQASARRNDQQGNDTAFDTHLQNAQHQQASTTNGSTDQGDRHQDGDTTQGAAGRDANAQPSNAQPGNAAKLGADVTVPGATSATLADDSDGSSTASVGSLANSVLSLIDQATGDADSGNTPSAATTKPVAEKPSTPPGNPALPAPTPQTAAIAPVPIPATPSAVKGGTDTNTNTSVGATQANGAAASNINTALTLSAWSAQKPLTGSSDVASGDASDDADDNATDVASVAGGSGGLLQSIGDSTQALAGALMAGSHAASASSAASPATSSQAPSTSDLTALRGVFDATGLIAPSSTSTTTGHSLAVDAPVGTSGFAKELGQQVTWLSGQDVKQAQIRLNPQDLGPVDVKVTLDHGRVDVAFMTQHPAAATAVQQGLDQLHQMLGSQGLSLGHTSVGQHGAQQQFGDSQGQPSGAQTSGDAGDITENAPVAPLQRIAVGLVDAFA